jgi:hypothetical protein
VTLDKCRSRIDFLVRQRTDIDAAIEEIAAFVERIESTPPPHG